MIDDKAPVLNDDSLAVQEKPYFNTLSENKNISPQLQNMLNAKYDDLINYQSKNNAARTMLDWATGEIYLNSSIPAKKPKSFRWSRVILRSILFLSIALLVVMIMFDFNSTLDIIKVLGIYTIVFTPFIFLGEVLLEKTRMK
jgi:hypothetical protein